jgi:hypothetical protein
MLHGRPANPRLARSPAGVVLLRETGQVVQLQRLAIIKDDTPAVAAEL